MLIFLTLACSATKNTLDSGRDTASDSVVDTSYDTATDTASDTSPAPVETTFGVTMIRVEAGTFTMGSPSGEVGRATNEAQVIVTLTHSFDLSATEVTQEQFAAGAGYNPSYAATCGDDCPVEQVSWAMAAAYTNSMSAAAGLDECYRCDGSGTGTSCVETMDLRVCDGFRLPTEAEWEYAARSTGVVASAFPNGGNLLSGTDTTCDAGVTLDDGTLLGRQSYFCGTSGYQMHSVGSLQPNRLGFHDMAGNAHEWVNDWYDAAYGGGDDPIGPLSGQYRVVRGGNGWFPPNVQRIASRTGGAPDATGVNLGLSFRVARTLP